MTPRRWLSVALLAAVTACTAEDQRPPNIIYMLADDLGYGELGSFGQTKIRTPNLDRLATEGIRFTQHYSGSPVCAPSRGTLMTGLHTGHGQIRDNFEVGGYPDPDELGQMPLDSATYTIGTMLQDAGYVTGAIGKWGLGGRDTYGQPHFQGFDYFFGYLDQQLAHNYYPTHLWRNGERVPLDNPYFHPHQRFEGVDPNDPAEYDRYQGNDYSVDVMADDALEFLDEHSDEPFFLYLPFAVPHLALQVPDSSLVEYEGAFDEEPYLGTTSYLPHNRPLSAYAAMITRMDAHIGRILERLDELGLAENTLVIFTSDNGTTYTGGVDAEYFNSTAGLRGLKGSVYEGGVRVPFVARWPGRIEPGSTSDHVSAFWDMMPTFADVAGVQPPAPIDGISFLPALLGEDQVEHDALYWEYHGLWNGAQAVRMGKWKAVRLGGHDNADAHIELYDLDADPSETTDVSELNPEVVAEARAVMFSRTEAELSEWNFARPDTALGVPLIDLSSETDRQVTVDREEGQYLGHPTTQLLADGTTILAVYPKGHGSGPIVYKRSEDAGLTWSERLPVPASWETSKEVPTLYRVPKPEGGERLVMFSGLYPIRRAISDDDGVTWSELEAVGKFGGIVAVSSVHAQASGDLLAFFHDDGRFLRDAGETSSFQVFATRSQDGGITWSDPWVVTERPDADLCEPGLVVSPDGSRLALLLRENSRTHQSFVVFSDDDGESWSEPRELPASLTGDRHTARYAPDGRLVVTFRDMAANSPTKGDWVAWVGEWGDIRDGRAGQYRVRIMDNTNAWDAAYPGLELLSDGTFVTTTYGHWTLGQEPYVVSARFRLDELDARAGADR